jgi:hypothetical protein
MSTAIATFKPADPEDGLAWDYEMQNSLSDAINAAMDADDEASHWLWVKAEGRVFQVTMVTVDRDGDDACEITIHAKPL